MTQSSNHSLNHDTGPAEDSHGDVLDMEIELANPVLALGGVAIGTLAAIFAIPIDFDLKGALQVSSVLMSMGLCFGPLFQMLRNQKALLRAEHVLAMSPVFWLLLDMIQGRYGLEAIQKESVVTSFLAIALFAAGIWCSAFTSAWGLPRLIARTAAEDLAPNTYFGIGLLAFVLAFLRFAIPSNFDLGAMWTGVTGGRWSGAWARGTLGGTDAILDHFAYFGYVLPLLTVVTARYFGWFNSKTVVLLLLAIIIGAFLAQGGSRRIIGVLFGSAAVFWFLSKRAVRWQTLLGFGALGVVLLLAMETMLDYRNVGLGAVFDPQIRKEFATRRSDNSLVRVDDNFLRLAQTTSIFPDRHPYTTWRYFLWVAVRPVPRILWPGKPINPGFDLTEFLGERDVSLSSSVIGELFMAGGFIAVFLGGWFYGRLAGMLSRLLTGDARTEPLLIYSAGLLALFAGMRSMIELVLMSYVVLGWIALKFLHRFLKGDTNSSSALEAYS